MKVVIDIECNSLNNPTKIWCIVCKDIDTGRLYRFRDTYGEFLKFVERVDLWVGHNILEYDLPVLHKLLGMEFPDPATSVIDTLIVSRLVDYSRPGGHSIEQYGTEFGEEKIKFSDWTKWSQEMEDYCVRDVEICEKIYRKYLGIISDPKWHSSLTLEHKFQLIVNDLHDTGFAFNRTQANRLLSQVEQQLRELDDQILTAFPPKEVLIREFTPKATKFGTISRTSVPRSLHHKIHEYECGKTYRHTRLEPFNPSSHKQLIEVLNAAGWRPEDKTQAHIDTERAINISGRDKTTVVARSTLEDKLRTLKVSGWKVNENNLGTLPPAAPRGARLLAQRILLEARRRSLVEWIALVADDGRIHGKFVGIGAWTHRMAHQRPNTANIPREFKEDGSPKLLGKELRELWCAGPDKLLVGVDAEGIQLRIFAHYIDDQEFTDALVRGSKANKTDPHSLNQRILGSVCKSRQAAKRFVYALLLGGGIGKLAVILGCSVSEAREALDRLLERYTGFARLRKTQIPRDAKQGWFKGLDGRHVPLPGETQRDREHLCMSGYLQNGEAIIIKQSALLIRDALRLEYDAGEWRFVNIVHDELQSETNNYSQAFAERVAQIKAEAIVEAGEYYKLKCPMAGSWWNDDENRATIGTNWYQTH